MKKLLSVLLTVFLFVSFSACGSGDGTASGVTSTDPSYHYSFHDSLGDEVTLDKRPETVAVLFSSYAEIWTLAGGIADITVGESIERGFAADNAVLVDDKAGHSTIDLEVLIASKPDFVIGTADYECQVEAIRFCRRNGIPAAAFTVESPDDYLRVLRVLCDITENEEAYRTYGQAVSARIGVLRERVNNYLRVSSVKAPRILFVRAGSSASSTKAKRSDDNFVCAMLADISASNIADSDDKLTGTLSTEAILVGNPEFLLITTMGDENAAKEYMNSLLQTAGWRDLSCVADGNYTFLPKNLFHFKPNARWAEAYEYLIAILYPEVSLD